MYEDAHNHHCIVVVDERTDGDSSEASVQVVRVEENPRSKLKCVRNKETVNAIHMSDGERMEVVHMDDGVTVQVIHLNGGQTLEVMHIDAEKHSKVIHVDGSNSIELISESEIMKEPVVTTFAPVSFAKRKEKPLLECHCPLSNLPNTIATQTDPCDGCGPSMNLLFSTFFIDGSVETQCDMPTRCDASVSTVSQTCCGEQPELLINGDHTRDRFPLSVKMERQDGYDSQTAGVRFSRSGRILKSKGPLFKMDSSLGKRARDCDNDFELQGDENYLEKADHRSSFYRKKRGRKKKRRLPSPDDAGEKLELANNDKTDGIKKEVDIKEEPLEVTDDLTMEISDIKEYGLKANQQSKKSRVLYVTEKIVKKHSVKTRKLTCQTCKQIFSTFSLLQQHAKEKHNSTEFAFPCNLCGMLFTRPHNLERHKDTKHNDGKKQFVCEHCGRMFGRIDILLVHISMVHKKGSSVLEPSVLRCTSCEKLFSKEHKFRQHREGNLACSDCAVSFDCKTSLRIHQYSQHPVECNECGKVCDSKHKLYFHRLTHAPKYGCKHCGKGFLRKSEFTVHIATHTGEKPVTCDICGKSFAHKLAVGKHKRQSHNESNKKLKCQTCGKSFAYKGKLELHMRTHTKEKPFLCHHCPSTFSQQCNLTAHIKSVHGVYIHSMKSDGTKQTKLLKYKRVKRKGHLESSTSASNTEKVLKVGDAVPRRCEIVIEEQVHTSELSETEAAVHQIVTSHYSIDQF
ncbi:zinc finger protein 568 isoform X2 [Procambarus clarkii]|uniref:zinc finger protein 568 isoform X2 n=1 Tax=Procambarus clarkii TaxID=6728 RepID=UPI00374295A8